MKRFLESLFPTRNQGASPEGMQIIHTILYPGVTEEDHAAEVLRILLFSLPMVDSEQCIRTTDGLISQAAKRGQIPNRWHVMYLAWFRLRTDRLEYPELWTECRIVVTNWAEISKEDSK